MMRATELLRELAARDITAPANLVREALAEIDAGSIADPTLDFTVATLARRYERSESTIGERLNAGEWGTPGSGEPGAPYRMTGDRRWWIPRATVVRREDAAKARALPVTDGASAAASRPSARPSLSLMERRRQRTAPGRPLAG
ncbi:MAG: hypothetical protein JWM27_102 [Gemmatimonadetes bacterium]|nr:hypothetical protein [Gemmatimonadota bacterium]